MTFTWKKCTLVAAMAGLLVAVLLGLVGLYTYHPPAFSQTGTSAFLSKIFLWVWPTGVALMDADANLGGFIVLFAAISNGLLYGLTVFCLGSIWELLNSRGKWV